jgi:hypothetical protein
MKLEHQPNSLFIVRLLLHARQVPENDLDATFCYRFQLWSQADILGAHFSDQKVCTLMPILAIQMIGGF